jgi:hypothetical protein
MPFFSVIAVLLLLINLSALSSDLYALKADLLDISKIMNNRITNSELGTVGLRELKSITAAFLANALRLHYTITIQRYFFYFG